MSILYELPSNIPALSQPSTEWANLLESVPLPTENLDDVLLVREERIRNLKAYLEAGPGYLGETNVQATDSSFSSPANVTLPIRIYTPCRDNHPNKTYPILLWFHGGGFVFGCNLADDELLRYICHHSHIVVVSAGYRLAPENPFPAAVEDAWSAAQWVRDNANFLRVDCNRNGFYVGGISAGGNLSAVVSRRARDRKSENIKIDGQLLGFPYLCSVRDHGFPAKPIEFSAVNECVDAPLLNTKKVHRVEVFYGSPNPQDPDFSPLWDEKELKGLPRAAVFIAGMDPLRDDGIAYWKALEKDGPNPRIRIFPGMPHGFHRFEMKTAKEFKKYMEVGLKELIELRGQHDV